VVNKVLINTTKTITMAAIQDVPVWSNGQVQQASDLALTLINDNLQDTALFYYRLLSASSTDADGNTIGGQELSVGNLTMAGTDYDTWGDTGFMNTEAYTWAAGQLNLVLI
jgi:hypothetical protein